MARDAAAQRVARRLTRHAVRAYSLFAYPPPPSADSTHGVSTSTLGTTASPWHPPPDSGPPARSRARILARRANAMASYGGLAAPPRRKGSKGGKHTRPFKCLRHVAAGDRNDVGVQHPRSGRLCEISTKLFRSRRAQALRRRARGLLSDVLANGLRNNPAARSILVGGKPVGSREGGLGQSNRNPSILGWPGHTESYSVILRPDRLRSHPHVTKTELRDCQTTARPAPSLSEAV